MSLKERINEDLKKAMKSGDKVRLTTIRSIRALILEYEKSGADGEMTSEQEIAMLTSAAKKRKDSMKQYEDAGRIDLLEKEKAEFEVLSEYLPEQMTEENLTEAIKALADELGAKTKADFKVLMPKAIQNFKGKADGKLIKDVVEKVLG
jgi:uncharacterized protein YqeY